MSSQRTTNNQLPFPKYQYKEDFTRKLGIQAKAFQPVALVSRYPVQTAHETNNSTGE